MQIKKAGFLTKIVILTLLIAATVSLLRLRTQIQEAQVELEDKVETLQHEQDMQTREMEKLRQDSRSMIAALEDAEAEVVNLKAELYDYMKAVD